jgi:Transposase IS116/IS110/IS902 family
MTRLALRNRPQLVPRKPATAKNEERQGMAMTAVTTNGNVVTAYGAPSEIIPIFQCVRRTFRTRRALGRTRWRACCEGDWHRSNETSKRLDEVPGVGPMLATAVVASIADPKAFRSGRDFSAWIGLVPKQNSSGGKDKLGSISKQGDRYLRSLFTAGALAVIRYAKIHGTKHRPWLTALLARRPTKVAAIALANKIARMVWAMMTRGERYKEPVALAA